MKKNLTINCYNEAETLFFAKKLAHALSFPCFMTLSGQLGAGKTTLSRGILQSLGHQGNVKSPTFTIVEPYQINTLNIYHFDLYRIHDIEELELMGVRDYFKEKTLILMEWPEKAAEILPEADINCNILIQGAARKFELTANTTIGIAIIQRIK